MFDAFPVATSRSSKHYDYYYNYTTINQIFLSVFEMTKSEGDLYSCYPSIPVVSAVTVQIVFQSSSSERIQKSSVRGTVGERVLLLVSSSKETGFDFDFDFDFSLTGRDFQKGRSQSPTILGY